MWTTKVVWTALGTAALVLLAAVLVGVFSRTSSGNEVLQYFDHEFLKHAAAYQRSAVLVFAINQVLTWGFLTIVAVVLWRQIPVLKGLPRPGVAGYLALLVIALYLLTFPLDYYRGFVLEHRFGLSVQSLSSWLRDYAKSFVISFVLTIIALLGLYILMVYLSERWWIFAGVLFTLFLILSTYLYPVIIDPLFYRFETLENEEMRPSILKMAGEAGIEVEEVLIADASRRTTRVNAYFAGMGRTKRIVIFDNLLTGFSREEALAVIAHEMGHWKHSHILKGIILGALGMFFGFFLLQELLNAMGAGADIRSLILTLLFFTLFSFVSLPFQNAVSRAFERQADLEAIRLTGDPRASISLAQNLARTNLSQVNPHPLVKLVLYTHPPVMERIKLALREAEK
ncbi:MAG: M48 family peptidase [Dethiobacter sp.]|nr:MAG: M48 family peptidase [Dethiobacter sp.]